jgi:hypothetical protein
MQNPFRKPSKRIITVKRGEMTAEERLKLAELTGAVVVELTDPTALSVIETDVQEAPRGKQDAVFMPDMTEEEEEEYIKDTELGWGSFKKKLAEIGKKK